MTDLTEYNEARLEVQEQKIFNPSLQPDLVFLSLPHAKKLRILEGHYLSYTWGVRTYPAPGRANRLWMAPTMGEKVC